MTTIQDDRTPEQKQTHTWLVIGTDRFMSGWGGAEGGMSYAAWACEVRDQKHVLEWVERRRDMQRVRQVYDAPSARYRPNGNCAHLHIYVVDTNHPALARVREVGIRHD